MGKSICHFHQSIAKPSSGRDRPTTVDVKKKKKVVIVIIYHKNIQKAVLKYYVNLCA